MNRIPESFETVEALFKEHISHHASVFDEMRHRDLKSEESMIREYSGRVIYELIQNALDRASESILVWSLKNETNDNRMLIVGNDGIPVSAYPRGKFSTDEDKTKEISDFHAILSLHTSSKKAIDSIGNKGIGFRSVFSSSKTVEVWSRSLDEKFWGLIMTHPSEWSKEKNSDWSDSSVASYYYPKLKLSNNIMDVIGNRSSVNMEYLASCNIKTLIILPDIDNSNLDASIDIDDTINKFRNLPLDFLSTRARNPNKLTVTLSTGDQLFSRKKIDSEEQWEEVSGDPFPLTNEMAQITGLELKEANYRVILAPETELNQESLYWSYLPTEKKAGYNLQIHADFYLSNSRRTVPFGSSAGNKPQDYNMKLLDKIGATITGKLWLRPEVANRNDFWNLIAPNNCVCQDLKWRACKTLLQKDYFIKLVTLGFTKSKEIEWKSSRYSDFFKFIEQLCDYAYKHQNLMPSGIRSRKQMKETLLQWIHESKANVLPIIENMEAEENYIVEKALALVIRTKGQQKQEFILYQRRSSSINLPDTVRKRGTWTTTFLPDGMDSGKPGMYGMTEFNRVEILKNLYTDGDISDHESEELLKYVIKITNEISDVGGGRSIWDRSKDGDFGRMWGLLHRDNSMREAWNSISKLKIPTLSGQWHRAEVVTDPPLYLINAKDDEPSWGWPILDRDKVKSLCSAALDKFTENDFAFLFGIPQGPPLSYSKDSKQYVISDWEHIIDGIDYSGTVSSAILEGWYHSYHPFFIVPEHERESTYLPIINSLQNDPWLCDDGFEERDITLSLPENCAFQSLAPSAVWLLRKGQGFQKINSLPHMILEKGLSTPIWVNDLNIKQVEDSENFIEKIVNAIKSISDNQILLTQWAKDTEELYTRLIKTLGDMRREINDDFVLPLLIRDYKESGKRGKLRWSVHGDSVWFDNGDSTQALRAFPEYKLWVVRRNYATIGEKMGVKTFRPIITPEWKDEEPETNLSDQVKSIVRQLLPDVLASTEIMGIVELNIEQLMARWSSLDFTHKVDVWETVTFDKLKGTIGRDDPNNSIRTSEKNRSNIIFDGSDLKIILLETSEHLADILFENRNLIPIFINVIQSFPFLGEGDGALERYRKRIGITREDIDEWNHKIHSFTLSPEENEIWISTTSKVLTQYGTLRENIRSTFLSVLPDLWDPKKDIIKATELDVQKSIDEAFLTLGKNLKVITPTVNFYDFQEVQLSQYISSQRNHILADYLYSIDEQSWSEVILESKKKLLSMRCSSAEMEQLGRISVDYRDIIYTRLDIPKNDVDKNLPKRKRAYLFARGDLKVLNLPKLEKSGDEPEIKLNFSSWDDPLRIPHGRTPASEDAYISDQRRKAERGVKAEEAILRNVVSDMEKCLSNDSESMWNILRNSLHIYFPTITSKIDALIQETQKKIESLDSEKRTSALYEFLHVAERWGDAGFDVIVLNESRCAFVEVKRIGQIENCIFYVSENERMQALRMEKHQLWRLWLVDNSGGCHDITDSFLQKIKNNLPSFNKLREQGIRPNEYMFSLSTRRNA